MTELTVAEHLVAALHRLGTRRIYGVPGGGSSLDLIAGAEALGMRFILARCENAAVMMAAADADISGAPGAVLTTKGPGLAQAMNGLAHASLDRAPVVCVTDGFSEELASYVTHQVFDQEGMSRPVVKGYSRLEGEDAADEIERLIELACSPRRGPVHIELTGVAARRKVAGRIASQDARAWEPASPDAALDLLSKAARPVVIVGLEARGETEAAAVARFVQSLGCPVLTTYKAKGVIPDPHPNRVGLFTGGAAEAPTVDQADLIVRVGLDPVELILQPWRYKAPVLDISEVRHEPHYSEPEVGLYGPLAPALQALSGCNSGSGWLPEEIGALRDAMRARIAFQPGMAIDPQVIVESAAEKLGSARITVDAGAHMLSATGFWPAELPNDVQISNGLASMAFALPAAIATGLADPSRRVLAFTGDGGLKMCLGELATAVQYDAPVTVIVFNDGALTMIDLKQQQRGMKSAGVRWPRTDFAAVAQGFGCAAWRVSTTAEYEAALAAAASTPGPSLIDIVLDPAGYAQQLKAMRG